MKRKAAAPRVEEEERSQASSPYSMSTCNTGGSGSCPCSFSFDSRLLYPLSLKPYTQNMCNYNLFGCLQGFGAIVLHALEV